LFLIILKFVLIALTQIRPESCLAYTHWMQPFYTLKN